MADDTTTHKPTAWAVISNFLTVKDILIMLWTVFGGSYVSFRVGRAMPNAWDAQDKFYGGLAAFTLGAFVFMGISRGALALWPRVVLWWRLHFADPPVLVVTPYSGAVAVLEILNIGGTGQVRGRCRILKVSDQDAKRQDPYFAIWRDDLDNRMVVTEGVISRNGGRPHKLMLADFIMKPIQGSAPMPMLRLLGNDTVADQFLFDPKFGSPQVDVEVTIETIPPLAEGFQRAYSIKVATYGKVVSAVEIKQ